MRMIAHGSTVIMPTLASRESGPDLQSSRMGRENQLNAERAEIIRLVDELNAIGDSVPTIATASGIAHHTLYRSMRGETHPRPSTIAKLRQYHRRRMAEAAELDGGDAATIPGGSGRTVLISALRLTLQASLERAGRALTPEEMTATIELVSQRMTAAMAAGQSRTDTEWVSYALGLLEGLTRTNSEGKN